MGEAGIVWNRRGSAGRASAPRCRVTSRTHGRTSTRPWPRRGRSCRRTQQVLGELWAQPPPCWRSSRQARVCVSWNSALCPCQTLGHKKKMPAANILVTCANPKRCRKENSGKCSSCLAKRQNTVQRSSPRADLAHGDTAFNHTKLPGKDSSKRASSISEQTHFPSRH